MRSWLNALLACFPFLIGTSVAADLATTIDRVKPSVVVVGSFQKSASPQFTLHGTGFVVGDGKTVATNAHVVVNEGGTGNKEGATLAILVRSEDGKGQLRPARLEVLDEEHDLALLKIEGGAIPALKLRNSGSVREGEAIAFTGFPIGGALGYTPVTHRGIVSAITPIAQPARNTRQLSAKVLRRLKEGTFNVFQLDATAYPGNSGGPMFDAETGEVIGIINMVFVKGTKEAVLSQPSGITYAIPANYLKELLDQPR